jgi:ElaB/YqjD/DUF883 family membrane-anchored ribosome-binding protein
MPRMTKIPGGVPTAMVQRTNEALASLKATVQQEMPSLGRGAGALERSLKQVLRAPMVNTEDLERCQKDVSRLRNRLHAVCKEMGARTNTKYEDDTVLAFLLAPFTLGASLVMAFEPGVEVGPSLGPKERQALQKIRADIGHVLDSLNEVAGEVGSPLRDRLQPVLQSIALFGGTAAAVAYMVMHG